MNSPRQPGVGAAAHGTGLQRRELPIGLACLCGDAGSGLLRAGCQVGKRYPGHQLLTGCGCFSLNPGMYTLESIHACSLQSCSHIHTHNPHQHTLVYRCTYTHTEVYASTFYPLTVYQASQVAQWVESFCNAGHAGDASLIPGLGRPPGEGNGYPLQYSCLENPVDGEAWKATVHGVAESQTPLSE